MKNDSDLGSYDFIDVCAKITHVLTIIAAIFTFIFGIIASVYGEWWYFIIIYIFGGGVILCAYFFQMMLISLCHDVYTIKRHLIHADSIPDLNSTNGTNKNIASRKDCPRCFGEISDNDKECPTCGYKLK